MALWLDNLAFVVASAFGEPADAQDASARRRALSDSGATACNRLASTDEPLGRCMNYAMLTLASAVHATALGERPAAAKIVIDASKLSASIFALWAHAGRVCVGVGENAVDVASTTIWNAIRSDVTPLATTMGALEASKDRVRSLRELAPSWAGGAPPWASPRKI